MNIYRYPFFALCPANDKRIDYALEITSDSTILVEDIIAAVSALPTAGYHEDIADILRMNLPGRQVIRAHHHGVDIETRREGRRDE
jgi:hypothetical protein